VVGEVDLDAHSRMRDRGPRCAGASTDCATSPQCSAKASGITDYIGYAPQGRIA
jgi:hypothetical protein